MISLAFFFLPAWHYRCTQIVRLGGKGIAIYSPHYRYQRYPGVEAGKFVDADSLGSASLRTPNGRALAGVR